MLLLKQMRKSLKLTQSYVAKNVGLSQQSYANYENETTQAPYSVLIKLANFFNCSIDELFDKSFLNCDNNVLHKENNFEFLRKQNGYSQTELANKLGVNQGTISRWESESCLPDIETIIKICNLYGCSIDYLLSYKQSKDNLYLSSLNTFSDNLKILRRMKNKTQKDIANYIGYQQTLVSKWEKGEREPSIDALKKISKYFNVSTDYLVGGSGIEKKYDTPIIPEYQQEVIDLVLQLDLVQCSRLCGYIEHQFENSIANNRKEV